VAVDWVLLSDAVKDWVKSVLAFCTQSTICGTRFAMWRRSKKYKSTNTRLGSILLVAELATSAAIKRMV